MKRQRRSEVPCAGAEHPAQPPGETPICEEAGAESGALAVSKADSGAQHAHETPRVNPVDQWDAWMHACPGSIVEGLRRLAENLQRSSERPE